MLHRALRSFLPNQLSKDLFPGFACFCLAFIAFVLGVIASETHWTWLAFFALTLMGIALVGGFFSMVYFSVQIFRRMRK